MRMIKFRAWNKLTHKMIPVWSLVLTTDQDGEICIETPGKVYTDHESGERDCDIDVLRGHNFELMQFTGLKDKNGVEIWEGDIVKDHHMMSAGEACEIFYEPCAFRLRGDAGYWILNEHNPQGYEVLGNIYEHPSLLTPQKTEDRE